MTDCNKPGGWTIRWQKKKSKSKQTTGLELTSCCVGWTWVQSVQLGSWSKVTCHAGRSTQGKAKEGPGSFFILRGGKRVETRSGLQHMGGQARSHFSWSLGVFNIDGMVKVKHGVNGSRNLGKFDMIDGAGKESRGVSFSGELTKGGVEGDHGVNFNGGALPDVPPCTVWWQSFYIGESTVDASCQAWEPAIHRPFDITTGPDEDATENEEDDNLGNSEEEEDEAEWWSQFFPVRFLHWQMRTSNYMRWCGQSLSSTTSTSTAWAWLVVMHVIVMQIDLNAMDWFVPINFLHAAMVWAHSLLERIQFTCVHVISAAGMLN